MFAAVILVAPDQAAPPSIVLILTDDQRWDTLWAMPTVQAQLVDKGVRFARAFVSNPQCCPSRASILTGTYSHTNGVWANGGADGGFGAFDDSSTVATWLDDAGYRTAYIGKYLNEYGASNTSYVPPGWDRWFAFAQPPGYYDYDIVADGTLRSYGSSPSDYSTDVLARRAVAFIEKADPSVPLFLVVAPYAPHKPPTPAPRDEGTYGSWTPDWPPSFNERNVSDKPPYIAERDVLDPDAESAFARDQVESLLAVDEAVAGILDALEDSGRLSSTSVIFTSDNGHLWGEHRWKRKAVPYEESIRVPLVIRSDGLLSPGIDHRLVVNIDLAPTIAGLAGIPAPGAEGVNLFSESSRSRFVIEHLREEDPVPSYCGLRTRRSAYIHYDGDSRSSTTSSKTLTSSIIAPGVRGRVTTLSLFGNVRSTFAIRCYQE